MTAADRKRNEECEIWFDHLDDLAQGANRETWDDTPDQHADFVVVKV